MKVLLRRNRHLTDVTLATDTKGKIVTGPMAELVKPAIEIRLR
jgi:hypothetical protein